MKHAILISTHSQFEYIKEFIKYFDHDFNIYIHIDKKSGVSNEFINSLASNPSVRYVASNYNVYWAGRNHIDCILTLCSEALLDKEARNEYYHLVSGADLLVKRLSDFKTFFHENKGKNFLEYFRLPYEKWYEGGIDRLEWRHPTDRLDLHSYYDYKVYSRYLTYQKRCGEKRTLPVHPVYGGSCWWSMTAEAVSYLCSNYNKASWYDRLKDTFVPDELFTQTLILNSHLKATVVNDNLRYICWKRRNGNYPANLDISDVQKIFESRYIFCRKIFFPISRELVEYMWVFRNGGRE